MDTFTAARWVPPGTGYMALEPEFIPRSGTPPQAGAAAGATDEDDGWLICMGFDTAARRSEVLLFDAKDVAAGPVTRLAVPRPVPHGLHGTWLSAYHGPEPSLN